jgi:transcriptional regulator with XRE-family HTH domain
MIQNPRKNRTREIEKGVIRYVERQINIAKQINIILNKLNITQSDLAKRLGKSESEISKWLSGTHNFTLKTISKIEDVLGESIIICIKDVKPEVRCYYRSSADAPINSSIPLKQDKENKEVSYDNTYRVSSSDEVLLTECEFNSN